MGKKVYFDEVQNFSNVFNQVGNEEIMRLHSLLENINEIGTLESFQGKSAQTAKAYLNEVHGTVMILLVQAISRVRELVTDDIGRFQQDVDSATTTIIDEEYLKEVKKKVEKNYTKFTEIHDSIDKTVSGVNDVVPNAVPSKIAIKDSKDDFVKNINLLDTHLENYDKRKRSGTNEVKKILKQVEAILLSEASYHDNGKGIISYNVGGIYEKDGVDKELINGNLLDVLGTGSDLFAMSITSKDMAVLAMNNGLTVQKKMIGGKIQYTIYGNKEQLKNLDVKMNAAAASKSKVKIYDSSKMRGYSKYGNTIMEAYPVLRGMTGSSSEMLKGFAANIRDPFTGGYSNLSGVGKLAKGLGVFGVAVSVMSNANEALGDGFQGYTDVRKITVDSTIDVGISGGLVSGLGIAGAHFGPVGAIVGSGIGFAFDLGLSLRGDKDKLKTTVNEKMLQLENWYWVGGKVS
ncbi:hypothetical protein HCJ19_05505 [Listeria seeligeri]|uniref:T7SS effector LXG polymorphic toxin n=2 Tax=Listeria seeligeri TaxID=1640 RepID=UPI001625C0F7|nr:T7SS effector LXG polymorphic toxin [Listeria seeligeri]MBC1731419.1 hypothetical protein [Listeria seeligeri]MBC1809194.1 hypothetical protein [Listeria seeligeri]MBC1894042.1 hypothetical protein [Listeria seeligeri]MBC1989479.1 hypothetical protein [Listeria seeligeri]MBC1994979.1 hypothetical protein [Listeria seeligeri]